ncbi:hypothetical protein [Jonesia quinghaiensis]|uniref:hypothetical protein n=1 Tax=Jonesia quinghaiensis TaxID=262806 RepID=UPI00042A48E8|nr:hypothetical protein [Jonesia quinghaiensis]
MTKTHAAWALALTAALLTGCATSTPTDEPSAENTETAEPAPGPDNPELEEAISQWQPLSDFNPERYSEKVGDFSAAELRVMSDEILNYARVSTAEESTILADSLKESRDAVIPWLPQDVEKLEEFSTQDDGSRDSGWPYYATRLPKGSTLLDSSVYTSAWQAEEYEYEGGEKGVELTLFWRILYRFEDPDGVVRAVPFIRWYSVTTDDPILSSNTAWWSKDTAVAGAYDRCSVLFDGEISTPLQPSEMETSWEFFTVAPDEFLSYDDYAAERPEPTEEQDAEEKAACAGDSA